MTEWQYLLTILVFFLVAALYSSAGFGGGSSYLAILVMLPVAFVTLRTTALLCNIMVVSGSLFAFHRSGELNRELLRKMMPLVLMSVPLAFLTGNYAITEKVFFTLLGIALVLSALAMFFSAMQQTEKIIKERKMQWPGNLAVGGVLGGLAGLVGIGGGIFLSPYLHLTNWDVARKISVTTAFFILVNSISGLAGQAINKSMSADFTLILPLAIAVLVGGQLGVNININRFSQRMIRKVTAVVILLAGINVLRKYWM